MSKYDVCLSFAGEDRDYVREVASLLTAAGVQVFYDEYEKVDLWGKDLYQHLSDVYRKQARYCVIFVSRPYAEKVWPRRELASAQARALEENREYILPARFDDTELPGMLPTTAYIDLRNLRSAELAQLIIEKLKRGATSARAPAAAAVPAQPAPVPPILRDQSELQALRRRLSEPMDEVERYWDVVQQLYKAGRWSFNHAVAYPERLLDADDGLTEKLREFSRELRGMADGIDERFEKSRIRSGTMIDAYIQNPLANVSRALRGTAVAVENLRDIREIVKRGASHEEVQGHEIYQNAATALNKINDEIEAAQRTREANAAMAEWFIAMGKTKRS